MTWLSDRMIPALSAKIPICTKCNDLFGNKLEGPVRGIFDKIEAGLGITDYQAEILIRWMWKFEGMFWQMRNGVTGFSDGRTLRSRVLDDLGEIRHQLILAIARIESIDQNHGDLPMGIDSYNKHSAVFVSGVFSKLAIIVSLEKYSNHIPANFSKYRLLEKRRPGTTVTAFKPGIGFQDDNAAVDITRNVSPELSRLHDIEYVESISTQVFLDKWDIIKNTLNK
ncbi:MAG TPA: hypothetical protein PLZ58_02890 [Candidatus Saccharibacteria bacterium]|nr:hypothetical protein [Candidatus Saccharibacteria bacterium]HRQ06717.1 hypothetical protein [Candidatus Saccharibacteria bacterium]